MSFEYKEGKMIVPNGNSVVGCCKLRYLMLVACGLVTIGVLASQIPGDPARGLRASPRRIGLSNWSPVNLNDLSKDETKNLLQTAEAIDRIIPPGPNAALELPNNPPNSQKKQGSSQSDPQWAEQPKQQQQQQQAHFLESQPHLKTTTDLLKARPTVHGFVKKSGILNWKDWSSRAQTPFDRADEFLTWRMQRKDKGVAPATKDSYTCAAADHPGVSYPGCHVFINEKYKYIYIRSPKAASTTIVDELGECTNTATRNHNSSTCMGLHHHWQHYFQPEELETKWKDYFVFGFVRNPWKRAYSLYSYFQSDACLHDDKVDDPSCEMKWGDFCKDPWSESEALHDKGCMHRSRSYLYFHMMDQYHCFRTAEGKWAVDFIGRVEETNDDWAKVVAHINKLKPAEMPAIKTNKLVAKNVRSFNTSDPYKEEPQCVDAVSRWYACDAENFAYRRQQT